MLYQILTIYSIEEKKINMTVVLLEEIPIFQQTLFLLLVALKIF